jgi:hypothetical protein
MCRGKKTEALQAKIGARLKVLEGKDKALAWLAAEEYLALEQSLAPIELRLPQIQELRWGRPPALADTGSKGEKEALATRCA